MRGVSFPLGLFLLRLLLPSPAFALDPKKAITQYVHDVWQTEEGLPQNSANAICHTRDGYLWVGTEEGLVRFDGVRFTVFDKSNTPTLRNNWITALHEDREGSLWIGTRSGLSRFKDGKLTSPTSRYGLSTDYVHSIHQGRAGDLWIGTNGGLHRSRDGTFTTITMKDGRTHNEIRALHEDRAGGLWIGTSAGGLNRLKDGTFLSFTTKDGLSNDQVRAIYEDREGSLWIGTDGGLSRFIDGKLTSFAKKDRLLDNRISAIYEDREGSLWIGTDGGGLNRLVDGKLSGFATKQGLSSNVVSSIAEDREGSLWIGTHGGGLNRLRDGKCTTVSTKEGLSNDLVFPIYEDRDGTLWIGTIGGGLNRLKDGTFTSFTTKDGLSSNAVYAIHQDRQGVLWIGTDKGLNSFRDGRFTCFTAKDGLSGDRVSSIQEDSMGSLWIGTNTGLSRLGSSKFTVFKTKDGLPDDAIRCLHLDRERTLWIGTRRGGLSRLEDGKFTSLKAMAGVQVQSIYEDRDGTLWIGTRWSGLKRVRNGEVTSFTKEVGLFDDTAFQILDDDQGSLWMSCAKGVFSVRKRDLDAVADGRLPRMTCVSYSTADGMRSAECNAAQPAGWKRRNGQLWFPTLRGVAVFDPARIPTNRILPPVVVEEVVADEKVLEQAVAGAQVVLPPGAEKLEFHYSALSLLAPQKVRFQYRLEGFDRAWVDAGTERVAHYTNLPPRSYTFRVKACNNDGVWNETGASFSFELAPHFYQTMWFYGLIALGFVGVGLGGQRARVARLQAQRAHLQRVVEERTSSLEGALRAADEHSAEAERQRSRADEANRAKSLFLANMSHELRTPLNIVLGFVQLIARDRGLKAEHREHLSTILHSGEHLLGLINEVLSISKIEAGHLPLDESDFDLAPLIADLQQIYVTRAASRGIWFRVEVASALPRVRGDAGKLRQVLVNLLENAYRLTVGGGITLHVSWEEGRGSFRVEDTGPGMDAEELASLFQPFQQTDTGRQSKGGTGLGLYISRSFVRRMGGDVQVTSTKGQGACFAFHVALPLADPAAVHAPEESAGSVVGVAAGQKAFRILVVDDLAENRELLVKLFTSVGLEVREASGGEEAVELWTSWKPDLICMDIRMAGVDGYEATRRIRAAEGGERRTVIIGLTASAFEHDREAILKAGCDDYLAKPFREEALFRRMSRHLGVRFVWESTEQAAPAVSVGELTRERLALLPSELLAGLRGALEQGDVQAARLVAEEIRGHDAALAGAIGEALKTYQLDRITELVERASP